MSTETVTRSDPRYVTRHDPRAVLVAWIGEQSMGGWTDGNEADFRAAVEDEARYGYGDDVDISGIKIYPADAA